MSSIRFMQTIYLTQILIELLLRARSSESLLFKMNEYRENIELLIKRPKISVTKPHMYRSMYSESVEKKYTSLPNITTVAVQEEVHQESVQTICE